MRKIGVTVCILAVMLLSVVAEAQQQSTQKRVQMKCQSEGASFQCMALNVEGMDCLWTLYDGDTPSASPEEVAAGEGTNPHRAPKHRAIFELHAFDDVNNVVLLMYVVLRDGRAILQQYYSGHQTSEGGENILFTVFGPPSVATK